MPELPEVETTRRGITPHILGRRITRLQVREPRLRWPVPDDLPARLAGSRVLDTSRRGKYLLLRCDDAGDAAGRAGTLMLHLGMSGSLRVCTPDTPLKTHDHLIWHIDGDSPDNIREMRFHDPRRFGCCLWLDDDPLAHPLLRDLGPEPLGPDFADDHLFRASRGKRAPVKSFLMDSHVVVGVGNIYANEALFRTGIHPLREAGRISAARYDLLTTAVRDILAEAITQGGTTLRDFVNGNGEPGYFQQTLSVYGRADQPCLRCQRPLREVRLSARSTVFCTHCQR